MKLVIADTGPLIHLHQAQALDLLPLLGEVVVTPQVIREWSQQAPERRPQSPPTWLQIVSPSRKPTGISAIETTWFDVERRCISIRCSRRAPRMRSKSPRTGAC